MESSLNCEFFIIATPEMLEECDIRKNLAESPDYKNSFSSTLSQASTNFSQN